MKRLLVFLLLQMTFFYLKAQITGIVFQDQNGDGLQQTTGAFPELGIGGVTLNAYDNSNAMLSSTTTAPDGSFSMPFTVTVRVEVELTNTAFCGTAPTYFFGTLPAGDNVRFIASATTNLSIAIHAPEEFRIANPVVFIPSYVRGDPLQGGPSATAIGFSSCPLSSLYASIFDLSTSPNQLNTAAIGSVWGTAYDKHAKKIFVSAFLKRNMGLGPLGSGGIYLLQPNGSSYAVVNFYDMDANGFRTRAAAGAVSFGAGTSFNINTAGNQITYLGPVDPASGAPEGLGVIGVNGPGGRNLGADWNDSRHDSSTNDQIAKVGLGDIEVSEDGRFLFLMNLYDRKLYRLELDNVTSPTTVTQVQSYSLPAIPVNNGVLRPFAISSYHGKLYIGAVATGENGGTITVNGPTDVLGYIFELNDPMGTPNFNASPILTIPFNYTRGFYNWNPWTSNTSYVNATSSYATPIISNIDFTMKGDMVVNITDRSGHQYGFLSLGQLYGNGGPWDFVSAGDVLIAGFNCSSGLYTLENNGQFMHNGTPVNSSWGIGNGQGIGGGEYFHDSGNIEPEGSQGSSIVIAGTDTMIHVMMDPYSVYQTGLSVTSIKDGSRSFSTGLSFPTFNTFGKGNSMGEVEMSRDVPEITIGNRVWQDMNGNGIQDPDEIGLASIDLELYADFNNDSIPDGTLLGTAITNAVGYYAFNKTNVTDGDPITPGNQAGLIPFKQYLIRVAPQDWTGGAGINDLQLYVPTLLDVGGNMQADVRDNDAQLLSNIPTIVVNLQRNGANNFNQDFGFNACKPVTLKDITLTCLIKQDTIGTLPEPGSSYSWLPPTGLSQTNTSTTLASPSATTIYTLTVDGICKSTVKVTVDQTPPGADAGQDQAIDCYDTIAVIGTPSQTGNTYQWNPPVGLSDPSIAQPSATPNQTTTYFVTVTGPNGCVSQDQVIVHRDICCSRITVPNVFSPNHDNLNDWFGVMDVKHVKSFTLKVFNRYGEEVFRTNTKDKRWDGTYKGGDCDQGTYFYLIEYDCAEVNQKDVLKGDINLVR